MKAEKFRNQNYAVRHQTCPACGTAAWRESAKFCRVCGKILTEEYQPLDAFRAAHRLQGKRFPINETSEAVDLFRENRNSASLTASAFVVYSLVPYLGILFCPGAFLMGGIGAYIAFRSPRFGGARTSVYCLLLSVVICAAQVFLWWLLYQVPELGRRV